MYNVHNTYLHNTKNIQRILLLSSLTPVGKVFWQSDVTSERVVWCEKIRFLCIINVSFQIVHNDNINNNNNNNVMSPYKVCIYNIRQCASCSYESISSESEGRVHNLCGFCFQRALFTHHNVQMCYMRLYIFIYFYYKKCVLIPYHASHNNRRSLSGCVSFFSAALFISYDYT